MAAALAACGAAPEQPPAPGVVARVDTVLIGAAQMRAFAERAPAAGDTPASLRESYLRGLLARHVLGREARARGLDTTSAVRRKVDTQWRKHMLRRYREEAVWGQVDVSESLVRAYFDSLGLGRQRQLWGILVDTQAEARDVVSLLRLGRSFEEVALQRSVHRLSGDRGGELGFVSIEQARDIGISDSLFHGLADGEISPVLIQGDRYQLVRFVGSRAAELGDHRRSIELLLHERLRQRQERAKIEELATQLHWRLEPAGLTELQASVGADGHVQRWALDDIEANQPLFSYTGGFVTLGEYVDAQADGADAEPTPTDSAAVIEAASRTLRTDRLFLADALRIGLGDEGLAWRQQRAARQMIIELRRQILGEGSGMATREDGQRYYDAHPEVFRQPDDIIVVEALVASEEEAAAVLDAVAEGASFTQLAAERTLREESLWQAPGTLRLGEHERITMAALYEAAKAAPVGVVTGPVELRDGFSVFQVINRQPGALLAFELAERRAKALAKTQRDTEVFERFIDDLLGKYSDVVRIYPSELEVALPDSLLLRLAEGPRVTPGVTG